MQDLKHVGFGILMGGADVIPGVSGGTVALVVGIYEKLVTCLSRFDAQLLGQLRRAQWSDAVRHVDLRFLIALGVGIAAGILALGSIMNDLLTGELTRPLTLAAFFGAIVASCILVMRLVEASTSTQRLRCILVGVLGAAAALGVTMITPADRSSPSLVYIFLCGMVAICAMILPGISGAFILLILGVYAHLISYIKALPRGQITLDALLTVTIFAAGCAVGLLSFSKLLRWLLGRYRSLTMSTMCGFMYGALYKIWPFQRDITPQVPELKHKQYQVMWPQQLDGQAVGCLVIGLIAAGCVLLLDAQVRNGSVGRRDSE